MAIRYLKTDTGYAPRLYCDQCGGLISEAAEGIAVSAGPLEAPGDTVPCAYLHKGECDDAWQSRHPAVFDTGSDELNVHFAFLIQNIGLPFTAPFRKAWRIPAPLEF